MTARQHVAEILKGIPQFPNGRVHFVERPTTNFPCILYNQISVNDQDLVNRPGVAYSSVFRIEVQSPESGQCEMLARIVLAAFQRSTRFLGRDFLPYETEQVASGNAKQLVYKQPTNYTIKEQ